MNSGINLEQELSKLNNGDSWGAKRKAAALLHVSRNTVTEWCRNPYRLMKPEHETKLAELLGMTVKELRKKRGIVTDGDNQNDGDVKTSSTVNSALAVSYIPIYASVTGSPFMINFDSPTLAEETMPLVQPSAGIYAGFKVENADFVSWNVQQGDFILVDMTQTGLQNGKRLLVEINGQLEFRLCLRHGDMVELVHASASKYPAVNLHYKEVKVIGLCKRKVNVEDF